MTRPMTRTIAAITFMGALLVTHNALAANETPAYAQHGVDTSSPIGWVEFCQNSVHRADCDVPSLPQAMVELTDKRWRDILAINAKINREVEPVTDMDHWGVAEKWSYPTDGKGDCEDYALEKRKRLMAIGFPRQALLITVVKDHRGDGHAVLMLRTDRGDLILDNTETKVKLWNETGYRFVKRQAQENPNRWVSLGEASATYTAAKAR